jgi:hypothetical protein
MRQFMNSPAKHHEKVALFFVALLIFVISPAAQHRALCQGTIDDRFAEVGQMVPAFGGCFTSGDNLYVYLVPGQSGTLTQVDEALTEVFGSGRPSGQLQALAGQYTFTQLKAWRDPLSAAVLNISGTVAAGMDYRTNQLIVLVENLSLAPQIESLAASLGIPGGVVEVKLMAPIGLSQTLQDFHRPDIGGLQISFNVGADQFVCTHWLADRQGTSGFVTNSHCSSAPWATDFTLYFQPAPPLANVLGAEVFDPPLFTGGACPAGSMCRYSDSNFSEFLGLMGGATRGVIARPSGLGSIIWNGVSTFTITAQADPMMDDSVDKVGRTTGRTRGTVTLPCMDTNGVAGARLLCQSFAQMNMRNWLLGGDSGSPVFKPSSNNATLVGIAWGSNHCVNNAGADVCPRVNCADGTPTDPIALCIMVFSPMSGVQNANDLGPLTVCQDGSC